MTSGVRGVFAAILLGFPQTLPPQQTGVPVTQPGARPDAPVVSGAISGVVVDGGSGAVVPNALVYLSSAGVRSVSLGPQTRQMTDEKGRFAFLIPVDPANPEGTFTISASKFGYLDGGYGRETSPLDPLRQVQLREDAWVGGLKVPLWKPGSISGSVRDEAGEPVVGVFVRALVRYRMQGREELASGPMTLTDDRGQYRMAGLQPGRYVIQVPSVQASMPSTTAFSVNSANTPEGALDGDETSRLVIGRYPLPPRPVNGRAMAYPIAFHPATATVADAAVIDLKFGDDRTSIDISLTPVPAARVMGIVEGPPEALGRLTLRLLPAGLENLGSGSEAATALVGPNGQFTFLNVPAGTYVIDAPLTISEFSTSSAGGRGLTLPPPPGTGGWGRSSDSPDSVSGLSYSTTNYRGSDGGNYSGRSSVTVGAGDLNGVVLKLRPNLTMSGRLVIENDPAQPLPATPPRFSISLDPAGGESYLGRPTAQMKDGTSTDFTISGVMPGQYWLRAQGQPAWSVKSIIWKGRDYATAPFDAASADDLSGVVMTVTNAAPELSGSVRTSGDLKPDQCIVILFPAEQAQWRNVGLWPARLKAAAVTNSGTFRLTGLPAGSYLVAAIDRSKRTLWRDPEFLARVSGSAARVTLTWGGKAVQDVPVVVVR